MVHLMIYDFFVKPVLYLIDPEVAHRLGIMAARFVGTLYRFGFWARPSISDHKKLSTDSPFGKLSSPLGLAAGCDKNAEALWGWQAMGFGFVEIGTVTPDPQEGNPRPRLFRFSKHKAIVNRMGFNNDGVGKITERIRKAKQQGLRIKVGGNIGKGFATPINHAVDDYRACALQLSPVVDYIVINVSSPNTRGLRELQGQKHLDKIVGTVRASIGEKPLFIKVAPDRFEQFSPGVVEVVRKYSVTGVICGNTLANHASSRGLSNFDVICLPEGGLSGVPVLEKNISLLTHYSQKLPDVLRIGVGGIDSSESALKYFGAGAGLVQIYTALIFKGPSLPKRILAGLLARA